MKKTILSFLFVSILFASTSPVLATYTEESSDSTSVVNSISLSVDSNNKLNWITNGYSKNGFKVVWSKNSGPTYPLRDGDQYHYYTDPSYKYDYVEAFSGTGTYYVRVCEYLGGKCGVYSNEVSISLGNSSTKNEETSVTSEIKENIETTIPAGYEKIPNIESIKYYKNIKKIGDTDLYGIKIVVKIPTGKEWIKSLADIKYFKNIEKVGDALYGTRITDEKKIKLQKQITDLTAQIAKIQAQIAKLTADLSSIQ